MKDYFSNGKFLLTGEYYVLQGAESIALPLKLGQKLSVSSQESPEITWTSWYNHKIFFEGTFRLSDFHIVQATDNSTGKFIQNLLKLSFTMAKIQDSPTGYKIATYLDFPVNWGMGSSSTLINNMAQWLKTDPYILNRQLIGGSGYDIACANSNKPLFFKIKNASPEIKEFNWEPAFKDHIYFVYSGQKQNSSHAVREFQKKHKVDDNIHQQIKDINQNILKSEHLEDFEKAITEHEEIISQLLNRPKAQDIYLENFPGTIKSLGAWGGDFILVTWKDSKNELREALKRHNHEIFFTWDEIIKNEKS